MCCSITLQCVAVSVADSVGFEARVCARVRGDVCELRHVSKCVVVSVAVSVADDVARVGAGLRGDVSGKYGGDGSDSSRAAAHMHGGC